MKTTKFYFLSFFIISIQLLNAQFPGKKSKNPFTSTDGHTYKVDETIKVNIASKGTDYQTIFIYKDESALETTSKFLDALSGKGAAGSEVKLANKEINNFSGKILFFKTLDKKGLEPTTYAIVDYKNSYRLAIPIDFAVQFKEIISNNPEYLNKTDSDNLVVSASNELVVKSFNPNFNVKLVSAEGNINEQTVTLTYLVSHKMVHQNVCFVEKNGSKLFDYNGNEYNSKNLSVGSNLEKRTSFVNGWDAGICNKIPTNVPVKMSVTYNKVLSSNKEFNYSESLIGFKDFDGDDKYNLGNIEVNNIKVDWR